ncbi:hypothetical protein NEUTE1DRAFT_34888, partial [Neurospora tetrasperma FGSC 2508]
ISIVLYFTIIIKPNITFILFRLTYFLINPKLIYYFVINRVKVYLHSTNYYAL